MSKEREFLKKLRYASLLENDLRKELEEFLAQPEPEPVTNEPTATTTAMAVMPNGVCVSNVYDAYKEGRKSVMVEQEPVAWITEWVQRYRHNDTPIMDRAVSFTKGDAPAVPNPNYIPLYTAPPKREPLGDGITADMYRANKKATHPDSYWAGVCDAEQAHGIGVEL